MTLFQHRLLTSIRQLTRHTHGPGAGSRQVSTLIIALLVALSGLVTGLGQANTAHAQVQAETFPASIKHVWMIVEENRDWSAIKGNSRFPYTNSLLTVGAHAENYHNVPEGQTLHPSEPNYIVMEAGNDQGLETDHSPSAKNSSSSTDHLTSYMEKAGISWKSYQEGISGTNCPLKQDGLYAPKHNPMIFFQDVTDNNSANSVYCIKHVRPYSELETDLQSNNVASYNFLTPNLCNDMHDSGCDKRADTWLSREIPKIMASAAYKDNGAIFVTWDEGGDGNNPIGMIVLSPLAKVGYSNTVAVAYSHASLLRTMQDIFGLQPYLGEAVRATSLSDLFIAGGTTPLLPAAMPIPVATPGTPAYLPSMESHENTTQTITINGDVNGIDDFERKINDVATRVVVPELQRALTSQRRRQGWQD